MEKDNKYKARQIIKKIAPLLREENLEEALLQCNNAIRLDPIVAEYYYKRAKIYFHLKQYEECIMDCDITLTMDESHGGAKDRKGRSLILLEKYKEAADFFCNIQMNALDVLIQFPMPNIVKVLLPMASNSGELLSKMLKSMNISIEHPDYKYYKLIYLRSLKIVSLLYVQEDCEIENGVAHYTQKSIAEELLFNKSPLRLSSVVTSNDPREGRTILSFLDIEDPVMKEDFQAFISCFTFNPECLNQFRLYGKENNQEATGVSLVFEKNFFKQSEKKEELKSRDDERDEKIPNQNSNAYRLFRCVYIDPSTKQVISVGQKEKYTFYRDKQLMKNAELSDEEVKDVGMKILEYEEYICKIQKAVSINLSKLKRSIKRYFELANINDSESVQKVVCGLLLNLRYLVKPVAFKEEQECRILTIEQFLSPNSEIILSDDKKRMFLNGGCINDFVKNIYFGPKTIGQRFFEDRMKMNYNKLGYMPQCYSSSHDYS